MILVGSGSEQLACSERARELGVSDRVRFTGRIADVDPHLAGADAFVFPSIYPEGMPNVVLEAMAAGLPCVVSRNPALRDVVTDGVDALVCDAADAESLACSIVRALEDAELAEALGRAARRRMEAEFDIRAVARSYLTLYGDVLARAAAR